MHQLAVLGATVGQWSEGFLGFDQEQRFVLLIIAMGCATGILLGLPAIVMGLVGGARRHQMEAEMKREMLDRGMTADEIAKVIQAATPPEYLRKSPRM